MRFWKITGDKTAGATRAGKVMGGGIAGGAGSRTITGVRVVVVAALAFALISCGGNTEKAATPAAPAHVVSKAKITQFYAATPKIARGMTGQLCYGVDGAKDVELSPAVEKLWPALTRCFDVKPTGKTTYTIKAIGEDGSVDQKTAVIEVGAAAPRLYDLWVNSIDVQAGQPVQVCFKTENTKKVTVSSGKLDPKKNCINDNPMKTTIYRITAMGGDDEVDTGNVTVKVHK